MQVLARMLYHNYVLFQQYELLFANVLFLYFIDIDRGDVMQCFEHFNHFDAHSIYYKIINHSSAMSMLEIIFLYLAPPIKQTLEIHYFLIL